MCTTPAVTIARNSSTHAWIRLHMPAIQHSEEENRTRKVMDVLPLCHKVVYEPWTVVEGQGHFTKRRLPRGTPPCSVNGVLVSAVTRITHFNTANFYMNELVLFLTSLQGYL